MSSPFVFHDPSGNRWTHARRLLTGGGAICAVFALLVLVAAATSPLLPNLQLPEARHDLALREVPSIIRGERAVKNVPFALRKAVGDVRYVRSNSPVIRPRQAARVNPAAPVVFGYYVNWDPASMVSLRLNARALTHLLPEWLILANAKGELNDESDATVIDIAREAHLPVLAVVTNYRDGWQAGELHQLLNNAAARRNLIDNIHANLEEHGFAGVSIDLEQLRRGDRTALVGLMRELRAALHGEGYLITEAIPVDDDAYDGRALAAQCDYIVPMVYDEHYQSGGPGPIASRHGSRNSSTRSPCRLPPEKTVVGMGGYGYDWAMGGKGGTEVSHGDVMAAALQNKGVFEDSPAVKNPVLRYTRDGVAHEAWFLDAVTGMNRHPRREALGLPRTRVVAARRRGPGAVAGALRLRLAQRRRRRRAAEEAQRQPDRHPLRRRRSAARDGDAARGMAQRLARRGRRLHGAIPVRARLLRARKRRRAPGRRAQPQLRRWPRREVHAGGARRSQTDGRPGDLLRRRRQRRGPRPTWSAANTPRATRSATTLTPIPTSPSPRPSARGSNSTPRCA